MTVTPIDLSAPFVFGDQLGKGTYGSVFEAGFDGDENVVAIKFFSTPSKDPGALIYSSGKIRSLDNGSIEESYYRLLCQINDSNYIARAIDPLIASGLCCCPAMDPDNPIFDVAIMPLINRGSEITGASMIPFRALIIARQMLDLLAHLKKSGVSHNDISSRNVLITPHDEIHLVDWSSASSISDFIPQDMEVTALWYRDPYGKDRDAFSVGILLWELFAKEAIVSSRDKKMTLSQEYVWTLFNRFENPPVPLFARHGGNMALFPGIALTKEGVPSPPSPSRKKGVAGYAQVISRITGAADGVDQSKIPERVHRVADDVVFIIKGLMSLKVEERRPVESLLPLIQRWCAMCYIDNERLPEGVISVVVEPLDETKGLSSFTSIPVDQRRDKTLLPIVPPCRVSFKNEEDETVATVDFLEMIAEGSLLYWDGKEIVLPKKGEEEAKPVAASGAGGPVLPPMKDPPWKEEVVMEVEGRGAKFYPIANNGTEMAPMEPVEGRLRLPFTGRFVRVEKEGEPPFFVPVKEGERINLTEQRTSISLKSRFPWATKAIFFTQEGLMRHESRCVDVVWLQANREYSLACMEKGVVRVQVPFQASPKGALQIDDLLREGTTLKFLRGVDPYQAQLDINSLPFRFTHLDIERNTNIDGNKRDRYMRKDVEKANGVINLLSEADIVSITPYSTDQPEEGKWDSVVLPLFGGQQVRYPFPGHISCFDKHIKTIKINSYQTPDTVFWGGKQMPAFFEQTSECNLCYVTGATIEYEAVVIVSMQGRRS